MDALIYNAQNKTLPTKGGSMRTLKLSIPLLTLILLTLWLVFGRGDSNALWKIVSQQCVPNQQQNNTSAPCLKVDLQKGYIVFKDAKGPLHDLIIPTDKISGIESPILQTENAPSLFASAWENRKRLETELGHPIKDSFLSLAINSESGRSQNQLHIHIACLLPEVYQILQRHDQRIGNTWKPLASTIKGHDYLAIKLSGSDLSKEDPFRILGDYATQQQDKVGKYGLAVVTNKKQELLLLANRMNLNDFNWGSAGEIQDYQCLLAGPPSR
ncbi:CDP-diacylglycerol diphosphatase [Pseudomonas chlororaphis subsp. aurantiaca]|uniref:CDP-diacylglycerol diphosphatase n=1 Tax=Pseudomonas chlororaphis TaxID=587753 RepID=UPI0027DB77DF|nr:CDP-diacylglycerol diphosphatase [Pseudomonas chlororaphis]WMI97577.1 CDP-diacylglycerol diphosphatase [Pseudomonas chlororaphis subsp. aurantiaca]